MMSVSTLFPSADYKKLPDQPHHLTSHEIMQIHISLHHRRTFRWDQQVFLYGDFFKSWAQQGRQKQQQTSLLASHIDMFTSHTISGWALPNAHEWHCCVDRCLGGGAASANNLGQWIERQWNCNNSLALGTNLSSHLQEQEYISHCLTHQQLKNLVLSLYMWTWYLTKCICLITGRSHYLIQVNIRWSMSTSLGMGPAKPISTG